jgi:hypothetical protein
MACKKELAGRVVSAAKSNDVGNYLVKYFGFSLWKAWYTFRKYLQKGNLQDGSSTQQRR